MWVMWKAKVNCSSNALIVSLLMWELSPQWENKMWWWKFLRILHQTSDIWLLCLLLDCPKYLNWAILSKDIPIIFHKAQYQYTEGQGNESWVWPFNFYTDLTVKHACDDPMSMCLGGVDTMSVGVFKKKPVLVKCLFLYLHLFAFVSI